MAQRWWGSVVNEKGEPEQLEFDVVAESVDKKFILVGECKWNQPDYAGRLISELKRKTKLAPFVGRRKVVYALFLRERPLDDIEANILYPEDIINGQ